MSFPFKKIWVLVKFWFISHTIYSYKQWIEQMIIILSYTHISYEQIIFLCMALFKLVASSSEEKVADFSEQCSRRVSSVVGAYWNPCSIHVGDTLLYYAVSWFNLPPHIHVFFSYTFPIPFSSGHVAGTFLLVRFLLFLN